MVEAVHPKILADKLSVYYGTFRAVKDVHLEVAPRAITALIGPSGCGKSTLLRCFNRMNDGVKGFRAEGSILVDDLDITGGHLTLTDLRKRVGMVFQRPNPFPLSVFENVAYGPRIHGLAGDPRPRVEAALTATGLWDELKDRLTAPALSLSAEQQQRLCISRLLAVEPEVLLMDEPCSALDPDATRQVEDLIHALRGHYTILIVTHNMAQARRASDESIFMLMGEIVEHRRTEDLFLNPSDPRTAEYVEGRYG